jgi:hypothetical protein
MKAYKTMRGWEVSNHRRRKDNELENDIDSHAHNQILKQQKQLNGRNYHIPISINTDCQQTHLPHQKTPFGNWIIKENPTICCLQETHVIDRNKHWLRVKEDL